MTIKKLFENIRSELKSGYKLFNSMTAQILELLNETGNPDGWQDKDLLPADAAEIYDIAIKILEQLVIADQSSSEKQLSKDAEQIVSVLCKISEKEFGLTFKKIEIKSFSEILAEAGLNT